MKIQLRVNHTKQTPYFEKRFKSFIREIVPKFNRDIVINNVDFRLNRNTFDTAININVGGNNIVLRGSNINLQSREKDAFIKQLIFATIEDNKEQLIERF